MSAPVEAYLAQCGRERRNCGLVDPRIVEEARELLPHLSVLTPNLCHVPEPKVGVATRLLSDLSLRLRLLRVVGRIDGEDIERPFQVDLNNRWSRCSTRSIQPNVSRSCCTTCSGCRSTSSRPSWAARRRRRGSWRAAAAAGCAEPRQFPPRISLGSAKWSMLFLSALRGGDFEGLLAVLDPDVVVRVDAAGAAGGPRELRGART
jgi:hypothetical protein